MTKNESSPLSAAERTELLGLVEELGELAACKLLEINRATLARAIACLPVRRATVIALRLVLKKRRSRSETRAARRTGNG
jgi:hypothetical protein